ncbi:hypothetical protein LOK49_LG11G02044 [Camellia lanceoleosa]|uniref:Uncharacterized protein n=1 Tax=Camellia lanceoleosa TaxID=1840588 RepID=A0ACC0G5N2_9ERIC|nr:hypothetical protein LOK49_LG11G02044 [Camellia lanceoleosa]
MSAIVCGKRSFFEDIPSSPQSSSSPPVSMSLCCSSSTSPVRLSSFFNSPSLLDQLRARFPDMDHQEPLHDIVGFRKEVDGIRIDVALQCSLDVAREKPEMRTVSLRDERLSAKVGDGTVTLSLLASAVSSRVQSGLDLHQLNIIMKVDLQIIVNITFGK